MRQRLGTSVFLVFALLATSCRTVKEFRHKEFVEGMEIYAEQILPKYRKFLDDDPALKNDAAARDKLKKTADDCQADIARGKDADHKEFVRKMVAYTGEIIPKYKAYVAASSLKDDTKKIRTRTADEWAAFVADGKKAVED